MNKIFNSTFENSLRVLLILSSDNRALSNDMISILDFISIYNKTLGVGEKDLNGQNSFAFCEYTTRRQIIKESIKELVLRGLIDVVQMKKGFCYKINKNGKEVVSNFHTNYAENYLLATQSTLKFGKGKNEKQLISFINTKANELGGYNE